MHNQCKVLRQGEMLGNLDRLPLVGGSSSVKELGGMVDLLGHFAL